MKKAVKKSAKKAVKKTVKKEVKKVSTVNADTMIKSVFRCPNALWKKVTSKANKEFVSINSFLIQLVEKHVK